MNVQNEILRLIGTGVILIWLVYQIQALQQQTFQFLSNIEQIKVNSFCFAMFSFDILISLYH